MSLWLIIGGAVSAVASGHDGRMGAGRPPQLQLTPTGNKLAEATVLQLDDFAARKARRGGIVTPPPSPADLSPCAGETAAFAPSEQGIVVNGIAESDYTLPGVDEVDSVSEILATPTMARVAWRGWATPAFDTCLRTSIGGPTMKVYSVHQLPFPKLGSFTAAYRATYGDPTNPLGKSSDDWILLAQRCARIRLLVTTLAYAKWNVAAYERSIAAEAVRRATHSCGPTA